MIPVLCRVHPALWSPETVHTAQGHCFRQDWPYSVSWRRSAHNLSMEQHTKKTNMTTSRPSGGGHIVHGKYGKLKLRRYEPFIVRGYTYVLQGSTFKHTYVRAGNSYGYVYS